MKEETITRGDLKSYRKQLAKKLKKIKKDLPPKKKKE
jgi:hypothetical protein